MMLGLFTTFALADAVCPHAEDILNGNSDNYYYLEADNGHILMCGECDVQISDVLAHEYYYYYVDDNNCESVCDYCGYVNETIPHQMTEYSWYDDEHCINYCYNCGWGDEGNLLEHDFVSCVVPATRYEAKHTLTECKVCDYEIKKYDRQGNIVFELMSEAGSDWDGSAVIVFENGEPLTLARNYDGFSVEEFVIPYNKDSVYHFMWLGEGYDEEFGVKIYFPDTETPVFEKTDMSVFENTDILYSYGTADYDKVYEALYKIPDELEYYTKASVNTLVEAVKGVDYFVHKNNQQKVDDMAKAVNDAVDGLVSTAEPTTFGVINLKKEVVVNDGDKGYDIYIDDIYSKHYDYEGDYTVFNSDGYTESLFLAYGGKFNVDIINLFGLYGTLGFYDDADVTLNAIGTNVFCSTNSYYAGIEVVGDAKLTITKDSENIVAIGDIDCAGIGSYYDEPYVKAGDITIDGGVVFALSTDDGAGIGGGYGAGFGKITINGGRIHAECLDNDGAGIGGDITALSLDDDGAGIGGADSGHVDSITINGGNILVGTDDAAAIGAGDSSNSFGGKIIINGGVISEHFDDSSDHFIGNDGSNVKGEAEDNFVQINGGTILSNGKIFPTPKNKDGKSVVKTQITVNESFVGKEIEIKLKDGTTVKTIATDTTVEVYLPENAQVTNERYLETAIEIVDTTKIFRDVKSGKWYTDAINYCYSYGFVKGEQKDTYGIDKTITRGMFITILARMAGVETSGNANKTQTKFTDVKSGKYYTAAIKWASENGIVNGVSAKEFAPDSPIERQQLCVMIVKFAKNQGIEIKPTENKITFTDANKVGKYAKSAVEICQTADILNGFKNASGYEIRPSDSATRTQAAKMLCVFHSQSK